MMGRMIKLFKIFPNLFQPLNYNRRRRTTNKKSNTNIDDNSVDAPTLHLPPIPGSNMKNVPIIRIKRARSQKTGGGGGSQRDLFSYSESNLTALNNNLSVKQNANYKSLSVTKSNNSINNSNMSISKRSPERVKRSSTLNIYGTNRMSNSRSTSDVPRLVAGMITEATSGKSGESRLRPLERQMVRIINGADPSVQSQVLLNTKTNQPWEDLVKDLGMAVRLPRSRKIGNRMETLYGRHVQSYSQLRSELKGGNNAFYVYADSDEEDSTLVPNLQHHRFSLIPDHSSSPNTRVKRSSSNVNVSSARSRKTRTSQLTKTASNSSSEFSNNSQQQKQFLTVESPRRRPHRRRSHTPSPTPTHISGAEHQMHDYQHQNNRRLVVSRSPSPALFSNNNNNMESRSVHFT